MGQQRTHLQEWASLLGETVPEEVTDACDRHVGRDVEDSWTA